MRKFINVIYMQKRTLQFISWMLIVPMGVGTLPAQAFSLLSENPVHPVNPCKILPTQPVTAINRHWTTINPYRYCGEQYDADLHMYFLRARYMETDRGRFWTMDSYEGRNNDPATLHKYLYAHADPVNGIDPSGEMTLGSLLEGSSISVMNITKMAVASWRGLKTAQYVAIFANGMYNGAFNAATAGFSQPKAFAIGFFGGAIGMWIGFNNPGAGAAFTNAFIEVNNAIFDEEAITGEDLARMVLTTLGSAKLAGYANDLDAVASLQAFLIQFDTQLAINFAKKLASFFVED